MTCGGYEEELALYVEGDLPLSAKARVEAHLGSCGVCRAFLAELQHSQDAVHDLAAAPIPVDVFARVQGALSANPDRSRPRWPVRWRIAAGLAATVTAAGLWIERPTPVRPHEKTSQPLLGPAATLGTGARRPPIALTVPPEAARSTVRARTAVSPDVTQVPVGSALSKEDADQLARAVVAISRIERLTDVVGKVQAVPSSPLMRIATNDPNIVIYWRLE
jgi:anti-sigma factor RsiW